MEMERRQLLKTAGATVVGLSVAGCMGEGPGDNAPGEKSQNDTGDEPVNASDEEGIFDTETTWNSHVDETLRRDLPDEFSSAGRPDGRGIQAGALAVPRIAGKRAG